MWLQLGCYYSATQFIFFQQFPLLAAVPHYFQCLPYLFTNLLWLKIQLIKSCWIFCCSLSKLHFLVVKNQEIVFSLFPSDLQSWIVFTFFSRDPLVINKYFPLHVLPTFQSSRMPAPVLLLWGPSDLALVGTRLGFQPEIISSSITVLARWIEVVTAGLHHLKFRVSIFRIENI